jgi:hypothetical protein
LDIVDKFMDDFWAEYNASAAWKNNHGHKSTSAQATALPLPAKPVLSPAQMQRKLEGFVIPQVEFRNATLHEAVDFLREKSLEQVSDSQPEAFVPFVPGASKSGETATSTTSPVPSPDDRPPWNTRITLSMKDARLLEALRRIVEMAHAKFWFEFDGLHVASLDDPDPVFARDFRIPAKDVGIYLRRPRRGDSDATAKMMGDLEKLLGDNMVSLPKTDALILSDDGRRLTVRATRENLDRIENLVRRWRPPGSGVESEPPSQSGK